MIQAVQVMRTIAALMVLLFHAGDRILTEFGWSKDIVEFGKYGVDIFFVISGFIMTFIHYDKVDSAKLFFIKRWIRIYPVYLEMLLLGFLVIWLGIDFRHKLISDFNYFDTLFLTSPNPRFNGNLILAVGWTLSFECWFYIIFGLSMSIFGKNFYRGIIIFFLVTLLAQLFFENPPILLSWRNFEFCFGVLLGILCCGNAKRKERIMRLDNKIKYPAFMLLIGDASYSLYLSHIPLLEILSKIIGKVSSDKFILINVFWAAILIIIPVVLSICNYRFIESKLIKYLRKKLITS